ncbi:peptidylprolyl isomerase [Leptolyngbya sp. 'hensonii']|uniref:peptidylprolyl isomerase n=1 Tax=Leptolyngbya sp. 'hensonii' TaxID=1922337 RepID=UPI00094F7448|nr:peptidylprolyl isomerase [Leptolyngbya sp. 'hensonii']OLP16353.1 peptidylprolyl isomerase [Leptolyngbya sp. 'hensonii']
MSSALQVEDKTLSATELLSLLAGYRMLPQLKREWLIDREIKSIDCTPDEMALARQQFYQRHQLADDAAQQAWCEHYGMTMAQLEDLAMRELKIAKFKHQTWNHRVESYFLSRKSGLDRVIYSLLRTADAGVAQELFFRLKAGEQSFAELAREYSQGPEAQTGGMVGPVPLAQLHPQLAQLISVSQPGQLLPPTHLSEWFVIVRLEKRLSAQLDEAMHQRLVDELFEKWLEETVRTQPLNLVR